MYIIITVQQLLQLLTGYALNKFSVLLLSLERFPDICIYCRQFSKAMSQLKYTCHRLPPPPLTFPPLTSPPPPPPKSMHQVIDIPEMSGLSLLLFSFFLFFFFFFFFLVREGGLGVRKGVSFLQLLQCRLSASGLFTNTSSNTGKMGWRKDHVLVLITDLGCVCCLNRERVSVGFIFFCVKD